MPPYGTANGAVMTTWNTIRFETPEPFIASIVVNRPATRNAINRELARELEACLSGLRSDTQFRVLILTGEGSAFGSGADLKERAQLTRTTTSPHPTHRSLLGQYHQARWRERSTGRFDQMRTTARSLGAMGFGKVASSR